jgi:hypothetical protein
LFGFGRLSKWRISTWRCLRRRDRRGGVGIRPYAGRHLLTTAATYLFVLGPRRRSGLLGHLQGSVAAAVMAHSDIPVIAFPERSSVERDGDLTPQRAPVPLSRASRDAAS